MLNPEFNQMLRGRKATVESVAKQIFVNPKALTQVLSGKRNGTPTWNKLAKVLSKAEYDCARKFADAARVAGADAPPYRPEKSGGPAESD